MPPNFAPRDTPPPFRQQSDIIGEGVGSQEEMYKTCVLSTYAQSDIIGELTSVGIRDLWMPGANFYSTKLVDWMPNDPSHNYH